MHERLAVFEITANVTRVCVWRIVNEKLDKMTSEQIEIWNDIVKSCNDGYSSVNVGTKKRVDVINAVNQALRIHDVIKSVCDVCGSDDVTEAPHMGKNCNRCHPL